MISLERFGLELSPESDLETGTDNMAHEAALVYIDDNGEFITIDSVEILSGEQDIAIAELMFKIAARLLEYEGVK